MAKRLALVDSGTPGRRARADEIDYSKFEDTVQATVAWLQRYEHNNLVCRSQGHKWPELHPNKTLPRGVHTQRSRDGQWQMVDFCTRCSRKRVSTLLPGNVLAPGIKRAYTDPKGYAKPKGLETVTRTAAFAEVLRRMIEAGNLHALPAGEGE